MVERKVSLIFGKRGSGKSFLAAHLIRSQNRYLIFDTLHEYKDGVIFYTIPELALFWKNVYRSVFRTIYRPTDLQPEFEKIAELCFACGRLTMLIEEIDTFGSPQSIPLPLANLIQRGRHKDINVIGVSQRPYGIPRILTSQAKEIFIFNTNEPRDRDYFRQLIGVEIDEKIDQLKQYEFVKWSEKNGQYTSTIEKV